MSVKDNKSDNKNLKKQSLASEILHNLKVENITIKVLLSLSILSNILIVIILKG